MSRRVLSGDGTLRVYADDGVTVLREERLPATTWNGVPVPFERVDTARASTPANPQPAPGQVWVPPAGAVNGYTFHPTPLLLDADGTLTVGCVDPLTPASVVWDRSGSDGETRETTLEDITAANGWRCIGVATERGRVMVGDRFHVETNPGLPYDADVIGVLDDERVNMRYSDGSEGDLDARQILASGWPTLTRYATARVGERYRERATGRVVCVDGTAPLVLVDEDEAAECSLVPMYGMCPAQWERLDPSTASHAVAPMPRANDPARAHRDEVRRAIDSAIAADKGQPFAHARAAALHAWAETVTRGDTVADVAAVHAGLLRYEALRGSRREPSLAAMDVGVPETARAMYERERAAVRVEAVTPRGEPARPTGGASLNGWQTAAHFWERWSR